MILIDSATDAQRSAVHQKVKKASGSWWHAYNDAWIVQGGPTANEWIPRLQSIFKTGAGSFLVFGMPSTSETRSWAYFGPNPNQRVSWLHTNYTKR
jgi:hypothetical protein